MSVDELVITKSRNPLRSQRYWWTLYRNGEAIFKSSEGYGDKTQCIRMGEQACRGEYSGFAVRDNAQ